MENAEATPRPWEYVPSTKHHGPYITSNHGGTVADLYLMTRPGEPSVLNGGRSEPIHFFHEMADPNAELIVRAVNAHDALVAALELADTALMEDGYDFDIYLRGVISDALLLAKHGASATTNEEAA